MRKALQNETESILSDTETVLEEGQTMHIVYFAPFLDYVEDVIIVNGDVWREDRPDSMTVSDAYDTCVYVKVGKTQGPEIWIPEIDITCVNEENIAHTTMLSYQKDTDSMNAKEKELLQQGYYIFHLGKLYNILNISMNLNKHYQSRIATTGFSGNVRIFNYIPEGYDSQGKRKWRKEEIKDTVVAEYASGIYLQVEWEDTSEHAYQWCKIDVLKDPNMSFKNIVMDGIEGEVWELFIYKETTIEFVLKPHTISLEYYIGDLTDISTGSGAKLSEDQRSFDVYGGDNITLNFALTNGIQLSKVMDNTGRPACELSDNKFQIQKYHKRFTCLYRRSD